MIFPPEIISNSIENHFVKHNTTSKVIYLTVLVVIITSIILLPYISVDITTQARGIIRTPFENNALQTVVYAEVKKVYISENSDVSMGDTLLLLNSDKIDEQIKRNREKTEENKNYIHDITNLLSSNTILKTAKYIAEYNYYKSLLAEQKSVVDQLKYEFQLSETLYKKLITPKQEYLQNKTKYESALEKMNNIQKQFVSNLENEKARLEIENNEITSSITQLEKEKSNYTIKAPHSGSIIQYSGVSVGSFISPGQTIAYISNTDNLIVECYLSPTDIGFIKKGQNVVFQLDAFNYNQWGMANGIVDEISNDIITINDKPIFRIRCSLNQKYLQLKNGYKGKLKKGMTLTGRFYLTERTLWQLLFDKVDDWMNPKIADIS